MPDDETTKSEELDWFEQPKNRKLLWFGLLGLCGLFLLLDFVSGRKAQFGLEKIPFFFAIMTFAGCAGIIFLGRALGGFLKRDEDYYQAKEESVPWDLEGGQDNE